MLHNVVTENDYILPINKKISYQYLTNISLSRILSLLSRKRDVNYDIKSNILLIEVNIRYYGFLL